MLEAIKRCWRRATIAAIVAAQVAAGAGSAQDFKLELTSPAATDGAQWLQDHGFSLIRDATNADRVSLVVDENGLSIHALKSAEVMLHRDLEPIEARELMVQWTVDDFPQGADWREGRRANAVMVVVYFDTEVFGAGLPFGIGPEFPRFIGFFACEGEPIGEHFTGQYFRQSARYVCVDRPAVGSSSTVTVDLAEHYARAFPGHDLPPVEAIALVTGTRQAADRSSLATIRSIELR